MKEVEERREKGGEEKKRGKEKMKRMGIRSMEREVCTVKLF